MSFDKDRLPEFTAIPFERKPFASARVPREWMKSMGIGGEDLSRFGLEMASIPEGLQDRYQVRDICRDSARHVLVGYICAMAWGGQGPGKMQHHAKRAWGSRSLLVPILERIKAGGLTRAQAYDVLNDAAIEGLGPSYFTKLIFFFMPERNSYIMDQWTAKSINYLTARKIVKLNSHVPSRANSGEDYERYCMLVEELRDHLATLGEKLSGEEVEQRIFSSGGKGKALGKWRALIKDKLGEGDDEAPEETKMDVAQRLFEENTGLGRQEMLQLFINKAKLTPNGAATYYYIIIKKRK